MHATPQIVQSCVIARPQAHAWLCTLFVGAPRACAASLVHGPSKCTHLQILRKISRWHCIASPADPFVALYAVDALRSCALAHAPQITYKKIIGYRPPADPFVALYAVDALRQLVAKLLDRAELARFTYQVCVLITLHTVTFVRFLIRKHTS